MSLSEKPKKPIGFDDKAEHLKSMKRNDEIHYEEAVDEIRSMARGNNLPGIREEYYQGWENDDFSELLRELSELKSQNGRPNEKWGSVLATPAPAKEKGPDKSYLEKATVNGTEISVGWDDGYRDYTIYFPQIKFGEEAEKRGVYDQVIRISERLEAAKDVFNYAVARAKLTNDVLEIYKKVESFSRNLPQEE